MRGKVRLLSSVYSYEALDVDRRQLTPDNTGRDGRGPQKPMLSKTTHRGLTYHLVLSEHMSSMRLSREALIDGVHQSSTFFTYIVWAAHRGRKWDGTLGIQVGMTIMEKPVHDFGCTQQLAYVKLPLYVAAR